ncbi:MAG: hypothetical protein OEL89_00245 [Candidatus Peregrinibacteria bacterium]|nr:hypothetical protein [Candidatus Peregrinibacteria bacterium]
MSKRFTETEKWENPFFDSLTIEYKIVWLYMLDKCDIAGIFKVNYRAIEFSTTVKTNEDLILENYKDRVVFIDKETLFIPSFIEKQKNFPLNLKNKCHKGIFDRLNAHGITYNNPNDINYCNIVEVNKESRGLQGAIKGYRYSIGNSNSIVSCKRDAKISPDLVIQLFNKFCVGKGFIIKPKILVMSSKMILNFQKMLGYEYFTKKENWIEYFKIVANNPMLNGTAPKKHKNDFVMTVDLDFLLDPDKAIKIVNGGYMSVDDSKYKSNIEFIEKLDNKNSVGLSEKLGDFFNE